MLLVGTHLKISEIHGVGVFATKLIPTRTLVWDFIPNFDLVISIEEFNKLPNEAQEYILVYGNLTNFPDRCAYLLCSDNAKFMNHSESPNIYSALIQVMPLKTSCLMKK